jgi:hypothetical protein
VIEIATAAGAAMVVAEAATAASAGHAKNPRLVNRASLANTATAAMRVSSLPKKSKIRETHVKSMMPLS